MKNLKIKSFTHHTGRYSFHGPPCFHGKISGCFGFKNFFTFFLIFLRIYLRDNKFARALAKQATTIVVIMLIRGIQGQLKMPPSTAGTLKAGIPWTRIKLPIPQSTATITHQPRSLFSAVPKSFSAKKASRNMARRGPVKSPVKKTAFFKRLPSNLQKIF